ncbi:MAG TPA: DUF2892 domain-containing protein [Burkholderiales bacterium]|nr:DUF2892 domain-containing protein [Burkholderiales bacterium]
MTVDNALRAIAGLFVLLSLALGAQASPLFVSTNFLWFTAFVGANLLQSGFSGTCPMRWLLRKSGLKQARTA